MRRISSTVVALLVSVSVVSCGSGSDHADTLPDVPLAELASGTATSASSIKGPAVVNLWATYCAPCRAEMPAFQAVSDDLAGAVRFIGVNEGDDAPSARKFLDEVGVSFDQYLDEDGALSAALGVTGLPATVVVDEQSHVVTIHSGALDEDEIRQLVATVTPRP